MTNLVDPFFHSKQHDSGSPEMQKYIEDFKEFMGKDVIELASKEPTAKPAQTIEVRGRKMAIPAERGPNRTSAVLLACLYALEHPEVDAILKSIGVKGYFVTESGTELRYLVEDAPSKPIDVFQAPAEMKRNILIEAGDPADPGRFVGIRGFATDKIVDVGTCLGRNDLGKVIVKNSSGKKVELSDPEVVWIDDLNEFRKILSGLSK
jgi:hypothetical protein